MDGGSSSAPARGSESCGQAFGGVEVDAAELDERLAAGDVDAGGRQDHADSVRGLAELPVEAVRAGELVTVG